MNNFCKFKVPDDDLSSKGSIQSVGEALILATEQMKNSFASKAAYDIEVLATV